MPASNCSARGAGQRGGGRRGGSFRRLGVRLPSRNVVRASACGFFLPWGSLGPGGSVPPPPSPFFSGARTGASGQGGGGGGKGFYFFSSAERRQRLACSLPVIKRPPARLSPALCCAAKLQTCRFLLRGPGALPAAATAAPPARPGRSPCASAALAGVSGRVRRCLLPHAPYGRRPFNCSSPRPCPLCRPPRLAWGDASAGCLGTQRACHAMLPLGPPPGCCVPPAPLLRDTAAPQICGAKPPTGVDKAPWPVSPLVPGCAMVVHARCATHGLGTAAARRGHAALVPAPSQAFQRRLGGGFCSHHSPGSAFSPLAPTLALPSPLTVRQGAAFSGSCSPLRGSTSPWKGLSWGLFPRDSRRARWTRRAGGVSHPGIPRRGGRTGFAPSRWAPSTGFVSAV